MSTAILQPTNSVDKAAAWPLVRRFAWKEFRVLWVLWIAAGILGLIIQLSVQLFTPPSDDRAAYLLSAALAAATLYGVGAAAASFAIEREEQTYDFLASLPATWGPIYVGKLVLVTASAVALAVVLSAVGWMLGGQDVLSGRHAWVVLATLGMAIFEGVAWGTLFSLLLRQPITAAIGTLVAATVAVNVAVYLSSSYRTANLQLSEYAAAVPLRLFIVAAVLAYSTVVARRWLEVGGMTERGSRDGTAGRRWLRVLNGRGLASDTTMPKAPPWRRVLGRLIWQTWRESRKLLPLPLAIAGLLVVGVLAGIILTGPRETVRNFLLASTSLFVPALYGALVFSADQRRRSFQFFAEHAVRPRAVWLARQIVWLGAVTLFSLTVWFVVAAVGVHFARRISAEVLFLFVQWAVLPTNGVERAYEFWSASRAPGIIWCAVFAAYAVGQLCSMVVRSDILAALMALVFSIFLTAWGAVLFAWQLSGVVFLLSIAAAALLATWLRAGDWIAQRNQPQAWLKAALPLAIVLVFVGFALPYTRVAQVVDEQMPAVPSFVESGQDVELQSLVAAHRAADTPADRETAAMYLRAVELFKTEELRAEAIKLAVEASGRASCRFEFDLDLVAPLAQAGEKQASLESDRSYVELNRLLLTLFLDPFEEVAFDRFLAALRMSAHLRDGQPSVILLDQFTVERQILEQIGEWAASDQRSNEELRTAIDQLSAYFIPAPSFYGSLIADYLLVSDVVREDKPSVAVTRYSNDVLVHLADLANGLAWERRRGEVALNAITQYNVIDAQRLYEYLTFARLQDSGNTFVRRWLRPVYSAEQTESWLIAQPAAATSYLARLEYQRRAPVHTVYRAYVDDQVYRRAALLRLALILYRRDHDAYPTSLRQLVPEYLKHMPLDPYTGQEFVYRGDGLDLPLYSGRSIRIEPGTPLFWSVGAGYANLWQWQRGVESESESEIRTDAPAKIETAYYLSSHDLYWGSDPVFPFPLPK